MNRSGNCWCSVCITWCVTAGPVKPISCNGVIGSPSGSSAWSAISYGVPSSIALVISLNMRMNSRLVTKPGASRTARQVLRSVNPTLNAVA